MPRKKKLNGVEYTPATITFTDKEKYIKDAEKVADEINTMSLDMSDDDIKQAKSAVAQSRKATAELDSTRKAIKREIVGNYPEFEKDIKDINSIISTAEDALRAKIKDAEEREQEEKFQKITKLFELAGKKYPFVSSGQFELNDVFDSKWLNKTTSMNKVEEQLNTKLIAIQDDLSIIANDPNESRLLAKYKISKNLTQAMVSLNAELKLEADAQESSPQPEEWTGDESEIEEHILTVNCSPDEWSALLTYMKRNKLDYTTLN